MERDRISVAFTTFNRTDLLYDAVLPFILDERVGEIVIVDDHSPDENIYHNIVWKYTGVEKVKVFRNGENLDCYRNKRQAVKRCSFDWVLLLDSDNVFSKEFIDAFWNLERDPSVAFAPEFARPHFDFTALSGKKIDRSNIAALLNVGSCSTMLNAMNYFFNRDEFMRVWDGSQDPVTSDSIFHNYNWLKGNNSIYVVPGMQYNHRVHEGSHYRQNVKRTPQGFHDQVIEKLKAL